MSKFGLLFLQFFLFAMLLPKSIADEQRINYGVLFEKKPTIDFATYYWTHICEIPMHLDLQHTLITKCPASAGTQCQTYDKFISQINYMRSYMNSQIQETKSLIHKMVPHLNATSKRRSKRALLPFPGSIMGNLFGLVSEDQLKKLVTHINALTKQDNKITTALKHYGGDLTSFITQVENRIDNVMNGIKRNQKL